MTSSSRREPKIFQLTEKNQPPQAQGLYHPLWEHDACGTGFVAHMKGVRSHSIVQQSLMVLENLTHRGATGADQIRGMGPAFIANTPFVFTKSLCLRRNIIA